MKTQRAVLGTSLVVIALASISHASQDTNGQKGIDSIGLQTFTGQPLTGQGEDIGMVEDDRPGRPPADNALHSSPTIIPTAVYLHNINAPPPANGAEIDDHAESVAGLIISTDPIRTGVATGANLYASAFVGDVDEATQAAQSNQFIATRGLGFVSAINLSFVVPLAGNELLDGKSLYTEFVDWSAAHHDVLYVQGNRDKETLAGHSSAIDNYNGITVGQLVKDNTGVWSLVSTDNDYSENSYSIFNRTFVDLLAPGDTVQVTGLNDAPLTGVGSSFAAPLVTGTVALLQQYGQERITAGDLKFPNEFRRHEVMKAVLLNSANKIKDDHTRTVNGIPVPQGGFLGMDRTVVDKTVNPAGTDWLQSDAYLDNTTDGLTPLDAHMGAGALSAKRALKQFSAGEQHVTGSTGTVPVIGWDYGGHPGLGQARKYQFAQPLQAGSFVSITLSFDRHVTFDMDNGVPGEYDIGDTFTISDSQINFVPNQDQFNDLDLYLLPKGSTNFDNPIALSDSSDSGIEHIFAQIPTTGDYEFWVYLFGNKFGGPDHYAAAWWAMAAITPTSQGDYDHNGIVQAADYTIWKNAFGTANANADGNGDGIVNAADYTIWRDHLGQTVSGSGSAAADFGELSRAVPEPSALALLTVAGILLGRRRSIR